MAKRNRSYTYNICRSVHLSSSTIVNQIRLYIGFIVMILVEAEKAGHLAMQRPVIQCSLFAGKLQPTVMLLLIHKVAHT